MNSNTFNLINKSDFDFSEKLREARISNNYTQEQVAELVDCSPRYLATIESGKTKGSINFLINLCNLYRLSPNVLFEDYLTFETSQVPSEICGYNTLNEEHKQIVLNSISFLNKLENN